MTAKLITTCAVMHTVSTDADEYHRVCVGHCPACHQAVMGDGSRPDQPPTPDGAPVWTCPADLSEGNPHRENAPEWITEAAQEAAGCYSNCASDFDGHGLCHYPHVPLHSACYDSADVAY